MSRLPLALQFVIGMGLLLLGAFLYVQGGMVGRPAPLLAAGFAAIALGLTLIGHGVVRRNRRFG